MTLPEGERLATTLLSLYGPKGYRFEWMERRERFSRAGQCNWTKKVIQLAPKFVELNHPYFVKHTILHEIAHAWRPKHGHNKYWKSTARILGHTGERFYSKHVKRR